MEPRTNDEVVFYWLTVGALVVIGLAGSLILLMRSVYRRQKQTQQEQFEQERQHERAMIAAIIEAQEAERTRIAGELHDGLVGQLMAIRMKLANGEKTEAIDTMLSTSVDMSRKLSHDLFPAMFEDASLEVLLADILAPMRYESALHFSYVGKEENVDKTTKLQIVRIVQEAVTNIKKHANASQVHLSVHHGNRWIAFSLADNGNGQMTEKSRGLGRKTMELRTRYLSGKIKFKGERKKGLTVVALIPNIQRHG